MQSEGTSAKLLGCSCRPCLLQVFAPLNPVFHATSNSHRFPNCLSCLQSSAVNIHVHGGQDESKPSTDHAAVGAEGAVVLRAEQRRRLLAHAAAAAGGAASGGLGLARPDNYKASAAGMIHARSSSLLVA